MPQFIKCHTNITYWLRSEKPVCVHFGSCNTDIIDDFESLVFMKGRKGREGLNEWAGNQVGGEDIEIISMGNSFKTLE